MSIFDPQFEINPKPYVIQMTLAGIFMLFVFVAFNIYTQSALIAAFSSSVFLAFTVPDSHSTDIRPMIGGYVVGMIIGAFFGIIYNSPLSGDFIGAFGNMLGFTHIKAGTLSPGSPAYTAFFAFLAFITTAFSMAATDTEHPPAVGISVGLVINPWKPETLIFIMGGILALTGFKKLFEKWMVDLI